MTPRENGMQLYLGFGVNVGNLGRRQPERESMGAWVKRLNQALENHRAGIRVIAHFAHTGNLVISSAFDVAVAAAMLSRIDKVIWVVVPATIVRESVERIREFGSPFPEPGVRWTPGIAFALSEPDLTVKLVPTRNGDFRPLSPSTVALWKRDLLTSRGILERSRRSGGWGALSTDLQIQAGGKWTSRSLRTIDGTLARATSAAESLGP
jgi:hypothetical protein